MKDLGILILIFKTPTFRNKKFRFHSSLFQLKKLLFLNIICFNQNKTIQIRYINYFSCCNFEISSTIHLTLMSESQKHTLKKI